MFTGTPPLIDKLKNAIALDIHQGKGMLFWSDVTKNTIRRAYMNGTGIKEIINTGLENPGI